jgi:hypothetical protein
MRYAMTVWYLLLSWSVVTFGVVALAADSQPFTAQSGPHTVALIELYTSEGCNSCPPADTWLSNLPGRGLTTDRLIPLALHVDYWDNLGWPDRFAQALFTQRQRAIAARHRTRTVYTPQVVLQGTDFRDWRGLEQQVQRLNATTARADLRVQVTERSPAGLDLHAEAVVPQERERSHAQLHVALYENNLRSNVTAGENRGRTLQHDFVVRQWLGPVDLDPQGRAQFQHPLRLEREWKRPDLGVVMFVQNFHSGEVLQALALPLAPGQRKGE